MRYEDEGFTDLDQAQRGSRPRRRWTGTVGQRTRAARRLPQAVFKISSYSHSARAVSGRLEYITREGEVEAEGPNGARLDQAALAALADEWSATGEARGRRVQAMSAFVSFPADVDQEQAMAAGRQFFREAFADNHDYVFAAHSDTKNFHVHVVVQCAGHDGKQLRIGREDIQDLRMLFAEKAQEQGIELDASPRWARGLEKERAAGPKLDGIMRRGRSPEQVLDKALLMSTHRRTQLEALVEERRERGTATAAVTPLEYVRAAERVAATIPELEGGPAKVRAMKAAVGLVLDGLAVSRAGAANEAAAGAAVQVAGELEKTLAAQIRELPEDADPVTKRDAWSALGPLANRLAATRPEPERKWARNEGGKRPSAQEVGVQAVEYAVASAGVVEQIETLTNDQDRGAAVRSAVQLARFGWELAQKDQGQGVEQEEARAIIDQVERALRFGIGQIEDPAAKREAIQARQALYKAGVKEYREGREEARREEQGRDEGWER